MLVDIVIPVYSALERLQETIAELERFTNRDGFGLFLIDDCSPIWKDLDTELAYSYFRNDKNLGFGRSCNIGASKGNSPIICFLNSDVLVTTGWLQNAIHWFSDQEVGVVGARLIYPESSEYGRFGYIQHAGIARNADGIPYHPHAKRKMDCPEVMVVREVNAVTGALLFTRRDVFEELGGFSSYLIKSTFEDVDYCWKVRDAGFKIIYDPKVLAYHYLNSSGAHAFSNRNLRKLLRCWGNLGSDEDLFDLRETDKRKLQIQSITTGWGTEEVRA